MKIRNGFVSNSSSSSFVVIFDKKPESVEELQSILYGKSTRVMGYDDRSFSTIELSKMIFNDITNVDNIINPNDESSIEKVSNEFDNLFWLYDEYDNFPDFFEPDKISLDELVKLNKDRYSDITWEVKEELINRLAKVETERFFEKFNDKFIVLVNYSDNDGSIECVIEHGDTFRNLNYIRISHH